MIKGNSVIECGISDIEIWSDFHDNIHHFIQNFKDVELNVDMEKEENTFVTLLFSNGN